MLRPAKRNCGKNVSVNNFLIYLRGFSKCCCFHDQVLIALFRFGEILDETEVQLLKTRSRFALIVDLSLNMKRIVTCIVFVAMRLPTSRQSVE